MFNITKTFKSIDGLHITPILMNDKPIFLCQEIEEQFGYSRISNVIVESSVFRNVKDYEKIEGDKLRELKELLMCVGQTDRVNLHIPSLIVLKESGLYKFMLRSDNPACTKFADWVVDEVLPSIRKTVSYTFITKEEKQSQELLKIYKDTIDAEKKLKAILVAATDYDKHDARLPGYFAKLQETIHYVSTRKRAHEILLRVDEFKEHCNAPRPVYTQKGKLSYESVDSANDLLTKRELEVEMLFVNYVLGHLNVNTGIKNKSYTVKEALECIHDKAEEVTGEKIADFGYVAPQIIKETKKKNKEQVQRYNQSELCAKGMESYRLSFPVPDLFLGVEQQILLKG